MKISEIYIYPIKSLRGIPFSSAQATRTGFKYDRRFMLLKVVPSDNKGDEDDGKDNGDRNERVLKNMHVPHFPEMALFRTEIFGVDGKGRIRVSYISPSGSSSQEKEAQGKTLDIPLTPDTRGLEELAIMMHKSPTKGYDMGERYNRWFSEWFGYEVVLAYLGDGGGRAVLGTFAPARHVAHRRRGKIGVVGFGFAGGVVMAIATSMATGMSMGMGIGIALAAAVVMAGIVYVYVWRRGEDERITFADTAPYMVVSEKSVADVSCRMEGEEMDVRKFRANVVVEGAERAFEEDFWAELVVGESRVRLLLTANCVRCRSLDVDYATGKMGTGESGKVLKKLMGDRRVDSGAKYSPVFGRYGFLDGRSDSKTICVGDEVVVARTMKERAIHDWPGLA
ncbi:MOSC domain-containing protein [Aspergillus cavernicola]|uniref:MOSC domain-containing protein n=1 Tax=Aspergillus cavernicola TaxID=176166 RepID=A0ABR4ICQ5_9EURO